MENTPVINNFNAGELSPYLYARNDLKKYNSGCLTLENFQVLPYGGVIRRPAIKFISESKTSGDTHKIRLIEFQFNSAQTYMLEFGNKYIRFYKSQTKIVKAYSAWGTGTAYKIGDLVTQAGSYYRCLIAHTSGTFATDLTAVKWQITSGATDLAYEIPTPYALADLYNIRFVQSNDVMYIVDGAHDVRILSRYADTNWTLETAVLAFKVFRDQNTTATTLKCSAITGNSKTLTALSALFDANHVGSFWQLKHNRANIAITAVQSSSATALPEPPTNTTNSILAPAGVRVALYTKGTWTSGCQIGIWKSFDLGVTWEQDRLYDMFDRNIDTSWIEGNTEALYSITKNNVAAGGTFTFSVDEAYDIGIVQITAITSSTIATVNVIRNLGANAADVTTTKWSECAWSDYRGWPSAISLWETRLIFASTISDPTTLWLSAVDDFANFKNTSLDDGAMTLRLNSGTLDEIRWIVPQNSLIIGTSSSEWALEAQRDNLPVTPTAFSLKRKTTYGSTSYVGGILINSAILFVMRQGRKLREFTFSYDNQDYVAPDMTILAEHITEGGIVNAAYQQQPDNNVMCIRADGVMIPMTYERDQDVTGWQRWLNDKFKFESVSIIQRDNNEDEIWVSCKLTVNGTIRRYIGVFDNREWGTDIATEWNGSDFYTVFDAVEQDGWKTITVSGAPDSAFNDNWVYSSANDRWDLSAKTIKLTTKWTMTDGTNIYSAIDNDLTTPPAVFIKNSTGDTTFAALDNSVAWYDSETTLNGKPVYYDYSDTYAYWFDGTDYYITIIADVDSVGTDYFKTAPYPVTIDVVNTETSADSTYSIVSTSVPYTWSDGTGAIEKVGTGPSWELNYLITSPVISLQKWSNLTATGDLPDKTGWDFSVAGGYNPPILVYETSGVLLGYGDYDGTITMPTDPRAYVAPTTPEISGLGYLEGKTVDIIRDGKVEVQKVVTGGKIQITKVGERVVVGLPYTSTMAPLYIEPNSNFIQPMGKHKGIFKAVIRFKDTICAKVGQTLATLQTVDFRKTTDHLDTQVDLFSGEKKVSFDNRYEFLHTCYVVQDKPLPMTVVAMIPWVNT